MLATQGAKGNVYSDIFTIMLAVPSRQNVFGFLPLPMRALDGMGKLLDGKEKDNLFEAGFTRAKADWILGMFLSRLYSIVNDDKHKVGRVKTPVLNIIASRDEAISAFTKRLFYKVVLENGAECENIYDTAEQAELVRTKCSGKTAVVSSSKTEQKKEDRPLLHSLTSLQQETNDVYGMTAADTLKSTQSLYEKKLLTYPRTDSSYISEDMIPLAESIVKCLADYDGERVQRLLEQGLSLDKRVVDNSKISDHHAIIPTNLIGRLDSTALNENEQRVAKLVLTVFFVLWTRRISTPKQSMNLRQRMRFSSSRLKLRLNGVGSSTSCQSLPSLMTTQTR